MNKILVIVSYIVLIAGFIAFYKIFPNESIISDTDTIKIYDTTTIVKVKDKPVPYLVIRYDTLTKTDSVYLMFNDSAECSRKLIELFKELHAKNFYKDTFLLKDSLVKIIVNSLISQNKIDSISVEYTNYQPTQIITNIVDRNHLYIGAILGQGIKMPVLGYTMKQYNFGVGYNIDDKSFNLYLGLRIK